MHRFVALVVLFAASLATAQTANSKTLKGASVFVESATGFESYLTAAILQKHVPLVVVSDRAKAEYIITSVVHRREPGQTALVVNNRVNSSGDDKSTSKPHDVLADHGETSASISLIDVHSSQVLFAYSAASTWNGGQVESVAGSCANQLKKFVEKSGR